MDDDCPKILLVDDYPANLLALEAGLGDLNLNLVKATSGQEALQRLLGEDFALILLDVQMPGMDGFETASRLRNNARFRDTPIIFVTAIGTDETSIARGYSLGAVDYLLKPFPVEALRLKVLDIAHRFRERMALEKRLPAALQQEQVDILAVDDHPENLLALEEALAGLGERLVTTPSPREALRLLLSQEFSLILIDIRMPEINGFELAELIRQRRRDLQIIFTTAVHQAPEDISRGYALGAVDYLFTPCSPDILRAKVRALVDLIKKRKALERQVKEIERLNQELRHSEATLRDLNLTLEQQVAERTAALRESQQQFHQAQKLEAIGRLAGGVAHDFNNLLTIIGGYSEMLLKHLSADHPQQISVQEIQKAADRGAGLIRQLLAFSRKQVLESKVLNLNGVVQDLEKMLRRLIGEDVELVAKLAPDLGQVKADPGQLEQVPVNLAVNARDAMPQGGQLAIETSNVELDALYTAAHADVKPGSYVLLEVSDSGTGMDAQIQAHIFEPFFTTKEPGKGTGLGLSTVYGIVKQSEGHIWVYSEVGQGTSFKIYLPRLEEAAAPAVHKEVTRASGGSETVLLVEDEAPLRGLMAVILREAGYTVLEASQGAEALGLAAQHQGTIHLIVTDMVMPGVSGRELAQQLTATHPRLKVLYMSGYSAEVVERQGTLEPGTLFLQKPFKANALLLKVREALDREG